MRAIRMTVRYDGTDYHGWQEQPGLPTVQGTLVTVAATILGHRPRIEGASRTDAGVHARGQVAALWSERSMEPERLEAALNSRLPPDIAVCDACEVPIDLSPSGDPVSKHYRYRLYVGAVKPVFRGRFVWHWYRPIEVEPMQAAARRLVGRHDFRSFEGRGSAREDTVREVHRLDVTPADDEIHVHVEGGGFLYKMVRNLVGTLVEVGRGKREPEWVEEVLATRDRTAAGPCAPPQGLCLMSVRYPGDPPADETGSHA
jgi:tRNA pseudouridine38-40 synthase